MRNWLEHRAATRPEATALTAISGDGSGALRNDDSWTYGELAARCARAASLLGKRTGLAPGERLALVATQRPETVVALHAAAWLGTPVVLLQPRLPAAEARRQLEVTEARVLVSGEPIPDAPCPRVPLADLVDPADLATRNDPGDFPPAAPQRPEDLATIVFTSGTTGGAADEGTGDGTGDGKGAGTARPVPLTWGNHLASLTASALHLGIDPDDDWLCPLPLCHVGGVAILLRSLAQGTSVTLTPAFEARLAASLLASGRITRVSLVPTMLRRLLEAVPHGPLGHPRLATVLVGGGPVDAATVEAALDRGLPVHTTFGMTETASQATTAPPGRRDKAGSAGLPLFGVEIEVRDGAGNPVAVGASGSVHVRGPMVSSAAAGPDGWLDSGDLGHQDEDGFLWIESRRTDRIVSGGENVDPARVEAVLASHPAVAEVAVVGLPDPEWGQRVVAAVVPTSGPGAATGQTETPWTEAAWAEVEATLAAHAAEHLAPHEVPRAWLRRSSLPRTLTGKLRRAALRDELVSDAGRSASR